MQSRACECVETISSLESMHRSEEDGYKVLRPPGSLEENRQRVDDSKLAPWWQLASCYRCLRYRILINSLDFATGANERRGGEGDFTMRRGTPRCEQVREGQGKARIVILVL